VRGVLSTGALKKPRRSAPTAISAQPAQIGSSTSSAIPTAIARSRPDPEVVTSNQASTSNNAAVTAASGDARGSRRRSNRPVPSRATPSIASSPIHAVDHPETRVVSGNVAPRTKSHGTIAAAATTNASPTRSADLLMRSSLPRATAHDHA
jgi:hypothetical protein